MALQKTKTFKGVDTTYHCIILTGYSKLDNKTTCEIGSYLNKSVRDENIGNFIFSTPFRYEGELTRDELYPLVILEPEFIDSIDC